MNPILAETSMDEFITWFTDKLIFSELHISSIRSLTVHKIRPETRVKVNTVDCEFMLPLNPTRENKHQFNSQNFFT